MLISNDVAIGDLTDLPVDVLRAGYCVTIKCSRHRPTSFWQTQLCASQRGTDIGYHSGWLRG